QLRRFVRSVGPQRAVRPVGRGDRVTRELAPLPEARLDRVVALLRVAFGFGEVDRPGEAVGEAASDEVVELRLACAPGLPRGGVRGERERDSRSAGRSGSVFRR